MKPQTSYWTVTNTPLYSFIFTLPLLLVYEVGLFAISTSDLPLLRNGADVLMRQILEMFGIFGTYGSDSYTHLTLTTTPYE